MSLKHVVLGYLSWRPMSGVELKTIIADAEILPWSASTNDIYTALVDLQRQGWVSKEAGPDNQTTRDAQYATTPKGLDRLKDWLATPIGPPNSEKSFLFQLLWADQQPAEDLAKLLDDYRNLIGEKLFFLRVQADEKPSHPGRSPRETYLWEMVYKNWIAHYELELKWISKLQEDLARLEK